MHGLLHPVSGIPVLHSDPPGVWQRDWSVQPVPLPGLDAVDQQAVHVAQDAMVDPVLSQDGQVWTPICCSHEVDESVVNEAFGLTASARIRAIFFHKKYMHVDYCSKST